MPRDYSGLTGPGAQAYRILAWAREDLPGRHATATKQIAALAAPLLDTPGPALYEVQDAGTILRRMAPPASK